MQTKQNIPYKGMELDRGLGVEPSPDRTNFVLNGRLDSDQGDRINYQNEPGNQILVTLPDGVNEELRVVVGHINLDRGRTFLATKSDRDDQYGLLEADGTYTPLITNSCLNLNTCWPVRGFYQVRNGCETVVYINDWINPDRIINIDKLHLYQNDQGGWDCEKMTWQPQVINPCVTAEYTNSGSLDRGQYRFAIELLDADTNTIRYSSISDPVFIWDRGSARITFENLGEIARYVRLWVIQYNTKSGEPDVYSITQLYPVDGTLDITYSGLAGDSDSSESINTILNPPPIYEASKVITTVDDRAVRANLRERFIDYSGYQQKASKICTQYCTQLVSPDQADAILTMMGDEVYDIGIVFEHAWGATSPEFHIPGRPKDYYGCVDGSNTGQQDIQTCLRLRTIGAIPPECNGYVSYEITYTDSTGTYTLTGFILPNEQFELVCVTDGVLTIDSVVFETVDPQGLCGDMEGFAEIVVVDPNQGSDPPDWDSKPITTWSEDLQFLGIDSQAQLDDWITENGPLETWMVYNTARPLPGNAGHMGYYECQTGSYDNDDIECIDDYWGVDCCGFTLDGNPIRHHRMPDRTLEPLYDSTENKVRRIGLKFSNIEYPDETVIGHYFVIRKRTDNTKTIVDKGLLGAMRTGSQGEVFTYFDSDNDTNWNYLMTPLVMNGDTIDGDYIKSESARGITNRFAGNEYEREYNDGLLANKDFYIGTRVLQYCEEGEPSWNNWNIIEQRQLQPGEQQVPVAGDNLTNLSFSNFINFVKTPSQLNTDRDTLHYVSVKKYRPNIYCDLFTGEYIKLHPCAKDLNTADGYQVFGGDTFITEFRVANASLRKVKDGIWDDILVALAIVASVVITVATAGIAAVGVTAGLSAILAAGAITSVGIGALIAGTIGVSTAIITAAGDAIRNGTYAAYQDNTYGEFDPEGEAGTAYQYYAAELLDKWYIESDTNYEFSRNDFESPCGEVPRDLVTTVPEEVIGYFYGKIAYWDDEDEIHRPKPIICPEVYDYNPDMFFHENDLITHIPLPITYNFCTACANEYPNMIIWSQKGFQNQAADGFRLFLANDFTHVGEHAGEITALHYDKNRLLVRTMQSMFVQSPNPRIINTDQDTAYVGTGDFFSIPEVEIVRTDYGYAGGQSRFDTVNTEFGWLSIDGDAGRVFLMKSDGLKEPSMKDAEQWMRTNLPLKLPNQVKELFGLDYHCGDSTVDTFGVGYMSAYDARFKRVIIHKTDYRIIKTDGLTYDVETGFNIPFTDAEYFENCSFTISYNLKYDVWESFFSYQPSYIWGNHDGLFSANFGNEVYQHIETNFGSFYGTTYDYIIEFEHTDQAHYILNLFEYYAQSFNYDSEGEVWVEQDSPTFDRMLLYTDKQSTGLQNLVYRDGNIDPWGAVDYDFTSKEVLRTSEMYRVNMIHDLAIAKPVVSKSWQHRQSQYNGRQGYIDLVSYDDNIDYDRNMWDLIEIRDRYHKARLFFKNMDDTKIVIDHVNTSFTRKQL